jgi:hypothetical protein
MDPGLIKIISSALFEILILKGGDKKRATDDVGSVIK